jgi:hypothetical protein
MDRRVVKAVDVPELPGVENAVIPVVEVVNDDKTYKKLKQGMDFVPT